MPANSPMAADRTSTPRTVGTMRAPFIRPVSARAARATTGMPSLMNEFQMPVTIVVSPIDWLVNPHDRYMV